MSAITTPRRATQPTLDAYVRLLSLRAAQRQRVGTTTIAAAAIATLGALGPEFGRGLLSSHARRRACAYFSAVLRSRALRDRRPEDREFLLLLRVGALVAYLRQAGYTEPEIREEVSSHFGSDGVATAERGGLLRQRDSAA